MRSYLLLLALCACCMNPARADSLFTQRASNAGTLVAEKLARFEIGDIITVIIQERIDASTVADTKTKKESDVESKADNSENAFLTTEREDGGLGIMKAGALPNWTVESENETKNIGTTRRRSTLITSISCVVSKVFPNGNIYIEGDKRVTVNREDSTLLVSGVIRSKDVTPANTVQSTQIANATVQLQGKGPLWNNQRRGVFTKILDWFSPF